MPLLEACLKLFIYNSYAPAARFAEPLSFLCFIFFGTRSHRQQGLDSTEGCGASAVLVLAIYHWTARVVSAGTLS
jgi:hypothetical protein